MKRILLLVGLLCGLFSVRAQKVVYDDNVQKREISSFHAIETSSGIEVIMTKAIRKNLP